MYSKAPLNYPIHKVKCTATILFPQKCTWNIFLRLNPFIDVCLLALEKVKQDLMTHTGKKTMLDEISLKGKYQYT
jgi:hypothetical protein